MREAAWQSALTGAASWTQVVVQRARAAFAVRGGSQGFVEPETAGARRSVTVADKTHGAHARHCGSAARGSDTLGAYAAASKVSLRTLANGALALTPHPAALGSGTLTHHITTDFSEAQQGLITGLRCTRGSRTCLQELTQIHQFVYRSIGDEMLWVGNMPSLPPCRRRNDPAGRVRLVQRRAGQERLPHGPRHHYGRRVRTISGIH